MAEDLGQAHIDHVSARGHMTLEALERIAAGQGTDLDFGRIDSMEADLDRFEQLVGTPPGAAAQTAYADRLSREAVAAVERGRAILRSLLSGSFVRQPPPSQQPPGGQPPAVGPQSSNTANPQEQLAQLAQAVETDPEGTARQLAQGGISPQQVFGEGERLIGGANQQTIGAAALPQTGETPMAAQFPGPVLAPPPAPAPGNVVQQPVAAPVAAPVAQPATDPNALAKILGALVAPQVPEQPGAPAGTAPAPRVGGTVDPRLLQQILTLLQPTQAPQIGSLGQLITGA